ncbi:hypothetical protein Trco_004505 [Trichoderma cornu-damae]|uniref:F-box domain-containing protein n=1 Tax=Trichoderma cornu-damae TaxID=654480 RepID=A0A9P8QT81_9HYPO|nr:hypothetical protein Trco_004505 [Trichoderma cornu-damae]
MERLANGARCRSTCTAWGIFKDKALAGIPLLPLSRPKQASESRCVPRQTLLSSLLQLPPELQFEILSYLDYGEIQRLRRTNRLFRHGINESVIKSLFPNLKDDMLCTCHICLTQKTSNAVIPVDSTRPPHQLSSRCFECIARRSGFMVGHRYTLVNWESVWVCRWCGYPVTMASGWRQHEFHRRCYQKYKRVLVTHFGIGSVQWMIVIIGSALCWHYFKHEKMVVAPIAVSFVMSFAVCLLGALRGPKTRTYHWSLLMEFVILTLWTPPMYAIITKAIVRGKSRSSHVPLHIAAVTLIVIALNMFSRLLNCLGHLILVCEWKIWQRSKPGTSLLQRALGRAMVTLIVWADPHSIEQDYPPTWWFKRW